LPKVLYVCRICHEKSGINRFQKNPEVDKTNKLRRYRRFQIMASNDTLPEEAMVVFHAAFLGRTDVIQVKNQICRFHSTKLLIDFF
jgi:hypothetical protein